MGAKAAVPLAVQVKTRREKTRQDSLRFCATCSTCDATTGEPCSLLCCLCINSLEERGKTTSLIALQAVKQEQTGSCIKRRCCERTARQVPLISPCPSCCWFHAVLILHLSLSPIYVRVCVVCARLLSSTACTTAGRTTA